MKTVYTLEVSSRIKFLQAERILLRWRMLTPVSRWKERYISPCDMCLHSPFLLSCCVYSLTPPFLIAGSVCSWVIVSHRWNVRQTDTRSVEFYLLLFKTATVWNVVSNNVNLIGLYIGPWSGLWQFDLVTFARTFLHCDKCYRRCTYRHNQ